MKRSRANRKRLRLVRYVTYACAVAGGVEHARYGRAIARAGRPFYRNRYPLPYGWQPRVQHCRRCMEEE